MNKTDKCVFMYTYGVVIIETYSCNKELYTYKSHSLLPHTT